MHAVLKLSIATVVGVLLLASPALSDTSPDRRESIRIEQVALKLDQLLTRVQALEKRIANLEAGLPVAGFRVDKNGILRDGNGHAGGFWGIDEAIVPNSRSILVNPNR